MRAKTRERRLAAVWFADIVGFTGLSSRDEDAALRLMEAFQAITRRVVRELGGTMVKFLGDGGLAVFPSADAAVRAGLAVQRSFDPELHRTWTAETSIRQFLDRREHFVESICSSNAEPARTPAGCEVRLRQR